MEPFFSEDKINTLESYRISTDVVSVKENHELEHEFK
jgi:hypothetical protein